MGVGVNAEPHVGKRMKIGTNLPVMVPGLDRDTMLQWAEYADEGFYSSLAAGERIAFFNPDIFVALSAAAACTERVKIVTGVLVPPMHSALRLAKQIATLDVLSNGRVVAGLGVGGREQDYQAVGADMGHRLTRLANSVKVMRQVWNQEPIVPDANPVGPAPVQKGGPELLAGSLQAQSMQMAARWADGLCGFAFGPSEGEIRMQWQTAKDAWSNAGRKKPPRLVMSFWYSLGPNARQQMDTYVERYLNFVAPTAMQNVQRMCMTTSEQALKDALKHCEDLETDEVILVPTTVDPDDARRVADLLS